MKLRRFLLRYYPPALIAEFELAGGLKETKTLDLLTLREECVPRSTDVEEQVSDLLRTLPALSEARRPQLRVLVQKLQSRLCARRDGQFALHASLRTHLLPLTRCAFSKDGSRLLTGSYDCTCRVWDTESAREVLTLHGHENAVYCLAFNSPASDRVFTGSFDHTVKVWDAGAGACIDTLRGHEGEVVCLAFEPRGGVLASGALDHTVRLWDAERGLQRALLRGHEAEVVAVEFNSEGDKLLTASFDGTVRVWNVRDGANLVTLRGHKGEVAAAHFDFLSRTIVSGSIDHTVRSWEVASGQCMHTLKLEGEVMDLAFNASGTRLAVGDGNGDARILDTSLNLLAALSGHSEEVCQVLFNPRGSRVLTASADCTARLWDSETGACVQVLEGHTDELHSCAFNYEGDAIVTAAKDNTCNIWRAH